MSSEQADSKSISLNLWLDAYNDASEVIKYTLATNHAYLGDRPFLCALKKYLIRCLGLERSISDSFSIYLSIR